MMERGVGLVLRMRWGALALGVAVVALALPVQASSATGPPASSLYTGVVKEHGVKIALSDDQGLLTVGIAKCAGPCRIVVMKGLSGRNGTRRAIAAARSELATGANYSEGDFFSFGAGVAYRSKQNLGSARMRGRSRIKRPGPQPIRGRGGFWRAASRARSPNCAAPAGRRSPTSTPPARPMSRCPAALN